MRIRFERRGGSAGIAVTAMFDVDSLPAEQALEVERLLASADFFELPPMMDSPVKLPGEFQYSITVQEPGRQHTVTVQGAEAPERVQDLLDRLTAMAGAHHAQP